MAAETAVVVLVEGARAGAGLGVAREVARAAGWEAATGVEREAATEAVARVAVERAAARVVGSEAVGLEAEARAVG